MKALKSVKIIYTAQPDQDMIECCGHLDADADGTALNQKQDLKPIAATASERPSYYHREIF